MTKTKKNLSLDEEAKYYPMMQYVQELPAYKQLSGEAFVILPELISQQLLFDLAYWVSNYDMDFLKENLLNDSHAFGALAILNKQSVTEMKSKKLRNEALYEASAKRSLANAIPFNKEKKNYDECPSLAQLLQFSSEDEHLDFIHTVTTKWRYLPQKIAEQQAEAERKSTGKIHNISQLNQSRKDVKDAKKKQAKEKKMPEPRKLTPNAIASILDLCVPLAVLASDETEAKKAPLYYYNYDTGIWSNDTNYLYTLIQEVDPQASARGMDNIIVKLRTRRSYAIKYHPFTMISDTLHRYHPVKNGVFDDLAKDTDHALRPFSPHFYFTWKTDTDYIDCSDWKEPEFVTNNVKWKLSRFIKQVATDENGVLHKDKELLLWQTLKASIIGAFWLRQAVILIDDGHGLTGKTTLLDLACRILGGGNVATLRLKDLQDANALSEAVGKPLIAGDDNDPKKIIDVFDNLNTTISGEVMRIRELYKNGYHARLSAFVLQTCNGFPPLLGAKQAVYNRLKIVKFTRFFDDHKPENHAVKNRYIRDEKLRIWVQWYCLNRIKLEYTRADAKRLEINPNKIGIGLVDTDESREFLKDVQYQNDSIAGFTQEIVPQLTQAIIPTKFLYALYVAYCITENSNEVLPQKRFVSEIKDDREFNKYFNYQKRNCILANNSYLYWNETENAPSIRVEENKDKKLLSNLLDATNSNKIIKFVMSYDQSRTYRGSGFISTRQNDHNRPVPMPKPKTSK